MPSAVDLDKGPWAVIETMDKPITFVFLKGYVVKLPTKYLNFNLCAQHWSNNFLFAIIDARKVIVDLSCSARKVSTVGRKCLKYEWDFRRLSSRVVQTQTSHYCQSKQNMRWHLQLTWANTSTVRGYIFICNITFLAYWLLVICMFISRLTI